MNKKFRKWEDKELDICSKVMKKVIRLGISELSTDINRSPAAIESKLIKSGLISDSFASYYKVNKDCESSFNNPIVRVPDLKDIEFENITNPALCTRGGASWTDVEIAQLRTEVNEMHLSFWQISLIHDRTINAILAASVKFGIIEEEEKDHYRKKFI